MPDEPITPSLATPPPVAPAPVVSVAPPPVVAPAPKPVDPGTVLPSVQAAMGATVSNSLPVMPAPAAPKDEPCVDCEADDVPEIIVLGGSGLSEEYIKMFFSFRADDIGAQKIGDVLLSRRADALAAQTTNTRAQKLKELGFYVHGLSDATEGK